MLGNSETIRIGIVGAGTNTRSKHIPLLQGIEGVEIVSVVNRSRESSERVSRQFGIPKVYDSWEELIKAQDTDAIVIGTWPYLHYPATMMALTAGKHVMCEARMAMNACDASRMRDAARNHPELVTQIVPSPLTLLVDNTVKRLIAEGYTGKILAVEVRDTSGRFVDYNAPLHWRQDYELSGYNVMSLGIWYEAIMRWIGEATDVTAKGKIFVKTRLDEVTGVKKAIQIPEHLIVLADMACGAEATFVLSSVTGQVQVSEAILFGEEGTLRFSDGVLYGARREDKSFSEIQIPPEEAGRWRVEEEFIAAIRGTETITLTTFEVGVKYMEFTEAVARSMTENRTITLPPDYAKADI